MNYAEIWPDPADAPAWALIEESIANGWMERIADTPDGRAQYLVTAKGFAAWTPEQQEEFGPGAVMSHRRRSCTNPGSHLS